MRARVVLTVATVCGASLGLFPAAPAPTAPVSLAAQACNCDAEAARLQEARDRLRDLQERLRDLEDQRRANAAAQEAARKSLADLQAQWSKQLGGGPGSGTGTFASSGGVEVRYNAQGQIQTYRNGQPVAGSERRSPFMSALKAKMDAAEAALKKLQDEQAQIDQQIQQAQQDIAKAEQDVAARQKELEDCLRRCAAASQPQPEPQPPTASADTKAESMPSTDVAASNTVYSLLRPYRPPITFQNVAWWEYFFLDAFRNALGASAPVRYDRLFAGSTSGTPTHGVTDGAQDATASNSAFSLFQPRRPPIQFRNAPWWLYFFQRAVANALGATPPEPYDLPVDLQATDAAAANPVSQQVDARLGGPIVRDRSWFFNTQYGSTAIANVEQRLVGRRYRAPYFDGSDPEDRTSDAYAGSLSDFLDQGAFGSHEVRTGGYGSYLDVDGTELGVNYTGILTSSFFVEGQYSERQFTFGYRTSDEVTAKPSYFLDVSGFGSHDIKLGYGDFAPLQPVPDYSAVPSNFFNTDSLSHELKFGVSYRQPDASRPSDLSRWGWSPGLYQPRLGLTDNAPKPAENWTTFNGPHEWDDVVPRLGLTYSLGPEQARTSGISAEYGRFAGGVVDAITRSGGNKAPLRTSYSEFADQLGSGVGYLPATSGMGAYLYTSTELENALRNDSFWEALGNRQYLDSIPGGTTRISSEILTPYTDEYTLALSNRLSNRAKWRDYSWEAFYTADDTPPETTTPPPGSNPTGYLQKQFKEPAFYDVTVRGKPGAPLHFSHLPTDDTYQLIIIVYVNTGPQQAAGVPDSVQKLMEAPWPRRVLGALAGWFRTDAPGLSASVRGPSPGARGAGPPLRIDRAAAREQRAAPVGTQPPISLVATGASSGEVFQLLGHDASSHVVAPDGLVVQPIRQGAVAPAPRRAGGAPPQPVTGYCLDYQKPPPPKGMLYQPAPDAVQQRFEPVRKILEAGRDLAEAGALKPDSNPADYATFIRQWALWTKLHGWDLDAFTREFVVRTRKNIENVGRQWNADMEAALKAAAPNRYWDILAVLAEAEGLRAAARP